MKGSSPSNCLTGKRQAIKEGTRQSKESQRTRNDRSSPSEQAPKKGRPSKTVKHLKMQTIPDLKPETITSIVKERPEPLVELTADGSISYIKFVDKHVLSYQAVTAGRNTIKAFLPWVHIAIRNGKRLFLDVHHKLKNRIFTILLIINNIHAKLGGNSEKNNFFIKNITGRRKQRKQLNHYGLKIHRFHQRIKFA